MNISVSMSDYHYLKEKKLSPSQVFRRAVQYEREMFSEYGFSDPPISIIKRLKEKIFFFQKEILKRNELIESQKDVMTNELVQEVTITERRIRKVVQKDSGLRGRNQKALFEFGTGRTEAKQLERTRES